MKRFIVTELEPVWIKGFYEVEAESEEAAKDAYWDGDYKYLGHTLEDRIESVDTQQLTVAEKDGDSVPFIAYPEK